MINNYMLLNSEDEIKEMRWDSNIKFKCDGCEIFYEKTKRKYLASKRKKTNKRNINIKNRGKIAKTFHTYNKNFCTDQCKNAYNKSLTIKEFNCKLCDKLFTGYVKQNPKYCGHSCAASYSNSHKTKGFRRSKLEIYLEKKLIKLYPQIKFKFNSRKDIKFELDIYIPSLKLAFELNGIFHYKPIYGIDKFSQMRDNDNKKSQACLEKNIELFVIDTSKQVNFKESTSSIYLDIIKTEIEKKLPTLL